MEQTFVIEGRLMGLNEYVNECRSTAYSGNSAKRQQEAIVGWSVKGARLQPHDGLVRLSFLWVEPNKRRDKDNVAFAKKFILDALVRQGVLGKDGWSHVDGFDDDFDVDRQRPRIEVTIKDVVK